MPDPKPAPLIVVAIVASLFAVVAAAVETDV